VHVIRKGSVTEGIKRTGGSPVFEIPSGLGTGKNLARHLKSSIPGWCCRKCTFIWRGKWRVDGRMTCCSHQPDDVVLHFRNWTLLKQRSRLHPWCTVTSVSVRPSVANIRCFNSTSVESVSGMSVGFVTMQLAGQNSGARNRILVFVLQTSLQVLWPIQSNIHCTGFLCRG